MGNKWADKVLRSENFKDADCVVILCMLCFLFLFRVTLEDLYNGKATKLQLSKNVICGTCKG